MPAGSWSDDTSMTLCTLDSFASDSKDVLQTTMQNFVNWLFCGGFTPTGKPYDVGRTCKKAILSGCAPNDEYSNGNGSLMRIHPVALRLYKEEQRPFYGHYEIERIRAFSSLTHAHPRSRLACVLYSFVLWEILRNPCKNSVAVGLVQAKNTHYDCFDYYILRGGVPQEYEEERSEFLYYERLFDGIEKLNRDEIQSDGYVVHTFEAAIWCLLTTDTYKDCVLKAVNLGRDTDTTAAVAGGLAGALYGYDAIPEEWRNTLLRRDYIEELCEKAFLK